MKNSFKFFNNCDCEYFPCHKVENKEEFNCLFCFCPLYRIDDCGGNCVYLDNGVKDCSNCLIPHNASNYDYIIDKLYNK